MGTSRAPSTDDCAGPQRRGRHHWAPVVAGLGLVLSTGACGDIRDQSMCAAFEGVVAAGTEVLDADVESLDADEAEALAQNYLDSVRHLQTTADERYDIPLLNLEAAVRDVVLTLSSVQDGEDYAIWLPLVEDDLRWAADAAAVVEDAMETQCPNTGRRD